ncbi:MAG: 5-formyltetrahydrofolate cyclo-ligase [Deltaproteobacteria bacterium]|nr:5-formyltetrahydrofolate cyclo-ligase [Deltaproteobacteria bacterium]
MDKILLRKTCLARQSDVSANELYEAGRDITQHLLAWQDSESSSPGLVAAFASLQSEVETDALIEGLLLAGNEVLLPAIVDGDLVFRLLQGGLEGLPIGAFGVRTPDKSAPIFSLADCELVVVPGLAFDRRGGRLGFGKGYYDRAQQKMHRYCAEKKLPVPPTVGIGMEGQLQDEVPMLPHDVFLSHLCTPARGVFPAESTRIS